MIGSRVSQRGEPKPAIYPDIEDAILGTVERFGMEPVILYDREKIIRILRAFGMSEETAEEYFNKHTLGTWTGDGTPAFARLILER